MKHRILGLAEAAATIAAGLAVARSRAGRRQSVGVGRSDADTRFPRPT